MSFPAALQYMSTEKVSRSRAGKYTRDDWLLEMRNHLQLPNVIEIVHLFVKPVGQSVF
jgi:hypothetical protein